MNIKKQLFNITCKDYCHKNNYKYSTINVSHTEKTAVPNYIDNPNISNKIDTYHPETYICELLNVNIIGNNNIIFDDNNHCIFDLPFLNYEDRFDLRYNSTYYVDSSVTCIDYNDSFETIDKGIMLITPASFNYYHFNLELLTKLCVLNEMEEYDSIPLLVDERILGIPNLVSELNFLNKSNRKIIYLKEAYSYKINTLIYLSNLTITCTALKPNVTARYLDMIVDSHSIKLLNASLTKDVQPFRKIFISRKYTMLPRLLNQDIVEEIFKGFDYEIVYPEFLSFNDTRDLFSESKFIAGTLGSGLTNILFASKNTTVICIQPKLHEEATFSCISNVLGQKCFYIDAIPQCSPPYDYLTLLNSPATVDIRNLVKFLNKINKN